MRISFYIILVGSKSNDIYSYKKSHREETDIEEKAM